MITHPFTPMLYAEALLKWNMDEYAYWTGMHIWLHKQPLFLWQMALSMRLFGINEFGLRLPSALMAAAIPMILYRCGTLIKDHDLGFVAALLAIYSLFSFQLASGIKSMDHNDLAFAFYFTLSFWAWLEYKFSGKMIWALLLGVFVGGAILVKWLTAFVIYGAWGLNLVLRLKKGVKKDEWLSFILSMLVCVAVFLPWQIYIMSAFPALAKSAYAFNQKHITEVLENHGGPWYFHLNSFTEDYGYLEASIIIPSFIILLIRIKDKILGIAILAIPIVVYSFFAIAQTKVQSHVLFVSGIFYLSISFLINEILRFIKGKYGIRAFKISFALILPLLILSQLNIDLIRQLAGLHPYRDGFEKRAHNKAVYNYLNEILAPGTVVFNTGEFHNIEVMFYTSFTAYDFAPTESAIAELKAKGRKIAVIKGDGQILQNYIVSDSTISIVNATIY